MLAAKARYAAEAAATATEIIPDGDFFRLIHSTGPGTLPAPLLSAIAAFVEAYVDALLLSGDISTVVATNTGGGTGYGKMV